MAKLSVHEITEFMLQQEEQLHLFELQHEGWYVWPLIRVNLMTKLEKETGLVQVPQDPIRKWTRRERYQKALYYDFLSFHFQKHHDAIIIEHPRKLMWKDKPTDIYTYSLQQKLPHALVINRLEMNNLNQKNNTVILLQESVLDKYNKTCQRRIENTPKYYEFEILQEAIKQQFNVVIDVQALFQEAYKHFVLGEERFMRFLDLVNPKEVYLCVAYQNYDIVSACKKKHVKVIELQHGIIDKHHLGYNYPFAVPSDVFVDEIYLFAPYWRLNTNLPLPLEKIHYIGFDYFKEQSQKVHVERKDFVMTVLSQGTSGKDIVNKVIPFVKEHPSFQVNYKLHPGEFVEYASRYPELVEASNEYPNLKICKDERNLYELLKESKYVVGAYSTAIYEGLALGCIGILVDVSGVREYMSGLINNDLVYISDDLNRDFAFIEKDAKQKNVKNIYF